LRKLRGPAQHESRGEDAQARKQGLKDSAFQRGLEVVIQYPLKNKAKNQENKKPDF
jgi:hypothetical protein